MKTKNIILLTLLIILLIIGYFYIQSENSYSVKICKWKDDKAAAISISFDDASYVQYKYALPVLEDLGFKASFGLVGEWTKETPSYSAEPGIFEIKKMGWNEIREISKKGHEICAHGYKHERYSRRISSDSLIHQMKKIKNLIEKNIGSECYTLHYPYSQTSDTITYAAKKSGFLFARSGEEAINPSTPKNMQLLASKAIYNNEVPALKEFKNFLKEASGGWLILMYHHLFPDDSKEMGILRYHKIRNTYSLLPSTFKSQMNLIKNTNYWVAPISTVGKYIEERDNLKIESKKFFNIINIKTKINLDTSIYDERVTLKIGLPWKKASVFFEDKKYIFDVVEGYILLNILPGDNIMIKKII